MKEEDVKLNYEKTGRFAMISFAFIEGSKELSFHARWLYVALMYYRDTKSGKAFPSYSTITKLTKMRRDKISDSIKELESKGWISRKKRYSNSTQYFLILNRFEMKQEKDEIES